MKRFSVILLGCFLLAGVAGCGRRLSEADQKWLNAVKKVVVNGAPTTRISTPSAQQASLLKDWAAKQGFGVAMSRTTNGYRIDLMRQAVQAKRSSR